MRTCIGCRATKPQAELIRIARDRGTGDVIVDSAQRAPGRGAYVCADRSCVQHAVRSGRLLRALRSGTLPVGLTEDLMRELEKEESNG